MNENQINGMRMMAKAHGIPTEGSYAVVTLTNDEQVASVKMVNQTLSRAQEFARYYRSGAVVHMSVIGPRN